MIQVRGLIGVVRLHDVQPAIAVIIPNGNAHTALHAAVLIHRTADLPAHFLEASVAFVVIEAARNGIAGYVNVRPAVIVEIGSCNPESVGAGWNPLIAHKKRLRRPARHGNARLQRHVLECSIPTIAIQDVSSAAHALRPASDGKPEISAICVAAGDRRRLQIEVHVIGDKQVEMAITIVIHEAAAGVPARMRILLHQARLLCHISKCSIAIVVIQDNAAPVCNDQIIEPVIVVVSDATALSPARPGQACPLGNVGKGTITIVVK